MAAFFGMKKLGRAEDWEGLAGDGKWRETRSAYELAHAWHGSGAGGIPRGITEAFDASGIAELSGLKLEVGFVEKPTFLDTPKGPSMTDIMGYARNRSGDPVILCIEGKATEPFGEPVNLWVRNRGEEALESRMRRLAYLADRLGVEVDSESTLYYQLLHRTVSAILEAVLHGAGSAVLLVHSFSEANPENWRAYSEFLAKLGAPNPEKRKISGPIAVGSGTGPRLFALWYDDQPRQSGQ